MLDYPWSKTLNLLMRHPLWLLSAAWVAAFPVRGRAAEVDINVEKIIQSPVRPLNPVGYTRALARKLGLDEGQQSQIRTILKEEKTEMRLLEDQLKENYQVIKETKLKMYDLHYEMSKRVEEAEERVREVLTPKQKIKFDRLRRISASKKGRKRAVSAQSDGAGPKRRKKGRTGRRRRPKPVSPAEPVEEEMPAPSIYR